MVGILGSLMHNFPILILWRIVETICFRFTSETTLGPTLTRWALVELVTIFVGLSPVMIKIINTRKRQSNRPIECGRCRTCLVVRSVVVFVYSRFPDREIPAVSFSNPLVQYIILCSVAYSGALSLFYKTFDCNNQIICVFWCIENDPICVFIPFNLTV